MLRPKPGALLFFLEALAAVAAFAVAVVLRTGHSHLPFLGAIPEVPLPAPIWPSRDYVLVLASTAVLWPACNRLAGTHAAPRGRRRALGIVSRHLAGTLLCALCAGFVAFALKLETVSRLFEFYLYSAGTLFLIAQSLLIHALGRRLRLRGYGVRRIAVFGEGEEAAAVARALTADPDGTYEVIGTVSAAACPRPRDLVCSPVRETLARADEALIAACGRGMTAAEQMAATVFLVRGKRVHIVPRSFRDAEDDRLAGLAELSVLSLGGPRDAPPRAAVRRAFDVAGGLVLGALSMPISLALAAFIKLDSPGPALFSQDRLGRDGKRFRLYKLRTMVADAEQVLEEHRELRARYVAGSYKLADDQDPRVTRAGRLLRRIGFDELPQFWNVLRGDMSLVGPRPIVPPELERYGDLAPLLLAVKPGLTGHWQVSRSPGYPVRAHLDIDYVLGRSLHGDVAILLRTVPTLLRRQLGR